jgi:hypothetical protein
LAQVELRPGLYEVTADMDLAGNKMSHTDKDCITPDFRKQLSQALVAADADKSCKISDYKESGSTITFNTTCNEDGVKFSSTTEISFSAESFTGISHSNDSAGRTTTIKLTGKRIGECKK